MNAQMLKWILRLLHLQEILHYVNQQDMAVANGHVEVLKHLKEKSGDVFLNLLNFTNSQENSPIHWAVINQQLPCIKYLVEQKADLNIKNSLGQKPLDIAVEMEYDDAVEALGNQTKIEKEELDQLEKAVEEHQKKMQNENEE